MAAKYFYNQKTRSVHHPCFPSSFRMLIIGQSGSGKTVLLMKLLLEDGYLNYQKLYIFARSLYQPEYKCLIAGFENNLPKFDIVELLNAGNKILKNESSIEELALGLKLDNEENKIEPSEIEIEYSTTPDGIPDPADLDMDIINLIIFDDIMTDRRQSTAEAYYTRGRSANCDSIYLSQNYTHLPLQTIRSNANIMIFFKSSNIVVEQLYHQFSSVDYTDIKLWKLFCKECWVHKFGYLVIDLSRDFESKNKYCNNINLI
jgi:hypothetical protein